jgi:DNA-binding transcriptional ArsR family regulator
LTSQRPVAYAQPSGLSTNQVIKAVAVDQLSMTFAALADPTRRAILARLSEGEATVNELAEPFPITLQAVSKHLRVLERARLIARGRSAQLRPSRLQGEALKEAADWLADYRGFWEDRFDRLDEHLHRIQKGPTDA